MTRTLIHERVEAAQREDNPTVICRMPSGWAVLGDQQFFAGYSLLLPDPVVEHLTDLPEAGRMTFLSDMAALGEAVRAVTGAVRINYEILGNGEPALHAHVFPRSAIEPPDLLAGPVWLYPADQRMSHRFDPALHGPLQRDLRDYLRRSRLMADS